ncbi:restriction endonuclease subunit S [Chitinimonas sp. PSY-7]|uniref:restriction endonuclease subunit S n=1 Tax=Chitinimonas sp. PSY-7 TaxID=3459088 RepID=UPI0040402F81
MSFEWPHVTVEQIAAPYASALATGPFGSSISSRYFETSGVPVIRGSNLTSDISVRLIDEGLVFVSQSKAEEFQRSVARYGDLVFTCWGTINQVGLIDDRCKYDTYIVSNKQMKLTVDQTKADPRFIYYLFSSPDKQTEILDNGIGSSVPGFNLGQLKKHEFLLPSLGEQRLIADFLEMLDDRITLLRETNATLEAIAQALFKSWFVDFDPVRAKQEGRAPEGMDEATAALFPDRFTESPLGLVPEGWRIGTLADLAKLNPESWTAKRHPQTVAYVDLANTKDNSVTGIAEFTFDEAPSRARRVLRKGDTIVGTVRPGNRSFAFISNAIPNLTGSTGFAVLRPTKQEHTEFVFLAATSDRNIDYLAHFADGGAYPAVRPEVILSLQSIVPNETVLAAFHSAAELIFAKIGTNQLQAQTLAALRDTLLPRLISGQLRLPEASLALDAQLELEGAA